MQGHDDDVREKAHDDVREKGHDDVREKGVVVVARSFDWYFFLPRNEFSVTWIGHVDWLGVLWGMPSTPFKHAPFPLDEGMSNGNGALDLLLLLDSAPPFW